MIKFLIKYESLYLMIMGMIHGITNLGGALLSAIVFSKNLSKDSKRTTIAICYLTFALFQIITLIIAFNDNSFLNIFNFVYWILGPVTFFTVEKYLYFRIDGRKYIKYSNFFLFVLGLMLIIKN